MAEKWLLGFRGGLVLVTHDRHLLDRVTTRIIELDRGRQYTHEGGYASYLAARADREEKALSSEATRRNLARRELAWLRRGAPARTRKPQARIEAATRLVSGRPEAPARAGQLEMAFGTPRLGDKVIECSGVGYRYGSDAMPVLSGVELLLGPSEALGLVGANGSGKSTLLDILSGRRAPSFGHLERGPTVVTGYYDQKGVDLDLDAHVRDLVAGATRPRARPRTWRSWIVSGSADPCSSLQHAHCPAASAAACSCCSCWRHGRTCFSSTSLRTISTWTRCASSRTSSKSGPGLSLSSATTGLSSGARLERLVELRSGTLEAIPGGLEAWMARADTTGEEPDRSPRRVGPAPLRLAAPPRRRSTSTINRQLRDAEREMSRLTRSRDALTEALAAAGEDHLEACPHRPGARCGAGRPSGMREQLAGARRGEGDGSVTVAREIGAGTIEVNAHSVPLADVEATWTAPRSPAYGPSSFLRASRNECSRAPLASHSCGALRPRPRSTTEDQ